MWKYYIWQSSVDICNGSFNWDGKGRESGSSIIRGIVFFRYALKLFHRCYHCMVIHIQCMREQRIRFLGITSLQLGVFGGILVGLGVGYLHNRFYKIKLPEVLSFFGGTRAVPVICTIVYVGVGILMFFHLASDPESDVFHWRNCESFRLFRDVYLWSDGTCIDPIWTSSCILSPVLWQTSLGGTMEVAGKMIDGAQNIFFAQLADPATTHFNVEATRFSGRKIPIDDLWIARSGICNLPLCKT